jgi:hypothetical protein
VIFIEIATWVLRIFGVLYLIGGLFMARQMWFWARITPSMAKFGEAVRSFNAEFGEDAEAAEELAESDRNRPWWLFVGALITAAAGLAMMLAHWLAVPLLAAIIVHQLIYFVRQRRRELAAKTPDAAAEARVDNATVNGFFAALVMAVLAAWLYHAGALA